MINKWKYSYVKEDSTVQRDNKSISGMDKQIKF